MYQLTYVSAAKQKLRAAELGELLVSARRNNERLGIGGMLLHHDGSFIQVLEGQPEAIENLFRRISNDPRHHRVVVLTRAEAPAREFSNWSMGFVDGDKAGVSAMPGFIELLRRDVAPADSLLVAGRAREFLNGFCEGRFRQFVQL